jgi:hypothetical protein
MARSRRSIRSAIDPSRIRSLLSGPNADTRTWIALGRVDPLPIGRIYTPVYGWVLDVTIITGPLTNEIVPCRFATGTPGIVPPPAPGAMVVVLFTDGDPNVQCSIMGYLTTPDVPAPTTVNGQAITEPYAQANHIVVEPTLGLDAELAGQVRIASAIFSKLLAPFVNLAEDTATQPFVRGTDLQSAINTFANALIAPGAYTSSAPVVASPALVTAVASLASALVGALSTRIKGE